MNASSKIALGILAAGASGLAVVAITKRAPVGMIPGPPAAPARRPTPEAAMRPALKKPAKPGGKLSKPAKPPAPCPNPPWEKKPDPMAVWSTERCRWEVPYDNGTPSGWGYD